jgi:glucose-6-phosphate dehydrogenase assembly protein OpcA
MIETVSSERPAGAAVEDIEKELVNLWRQVSSREKPMLRARVFTLLVVTRVEQEAMMAECVVQLAGRHPARNVMLLLDDADKEESLDADVTLLCSMRPYARCAEQIRLTAAGAALERLPAAARALLTANLSVVLWWTLPPDEDNVLFQELVQLSDRVIIDSSALEEVQGLRDLPSEAQGRRVSDLNWIRLGHWRESIAQCFDSPHHREYLSRVEEVTIETGQNRAAGWLLAGWLAARLGWEARDGSAEGVELAGEEGQSVKVKFVSKETEYAVSGVTLAGEEVRFEVRRVSETCMESIVELPGTPRLEQVTMLPDETEPALLSRELDRTRGDRIYREAVGAVQEMLERWQ